MKRWLLRICVLLLLGAIINVAVAWGCARFCACTGPVWSEHGGPRTPWELRDAEAVAIFHQHVPQLFAMMQGHDLESVTCTPNALLIWMEEYEGVGVRQVLVRDNARAFCGCPERPREVVHCWAGWPAKSLEGQSLETRRGTLSFSLIWVEPRSYLGPNVAPAHNSALPYAPVWPGFAINSVFYAFVLWLLFAGPFVVRRWRRIRRGLCPKCAYDLRGRPPKDNEKCPECGESLVPSHN